MANGQQQKKHQRLVCIKKKYIFAAQSTFKIMEEKEVRQTLDDIREMMSKSSRFQAISGWSIIRGRGLAPLLRKFATLRRFEYAEQDPHCRVDRYRTVCPLASYGIRLCHDQVETEQSPFCL